MESTLIERAPPGQLAGRSLDDWNAAYSKVECYFHALSVRNKLLLGQLVSRVLDRAVERARRDPSPSPTLLAMEELDCVIDEWFATVLAEPVKRTDSLLSTRGRLALLLANMPGQWQDQFLKPGPWPEDFTAAMRAAYLRSGPDFRFSEMNPRPIDLGAIATLTKLSTLPYVRMLTAWLAFALLLVVIFQMTR